MARAAAATGSALPRPASFASSPSVFLRRRTAMLLRSRFVRPGALLGDHRRHLCHLLLHLASCWARVPFCRTLWRTFSMPSKSIMSSAARAASEFSGLKKPS